MRVKEAMTVGVRIAEPEEALPHAAKKMRTQAIGALPVIENGELIGMLTDRDIAVRAVAMQKDPMTTKVRDVMSEECLVCAEEDDLDKAVGVMRDMRVRRLPVMNAANEVVGMLSIEDVAMHAPAETTGAAMQAIARRPPPVDPA